MFAPSGAGRWVLREGMSGWDIEAAEIALNGAYISANLAEDGIFGPKMLLASQKLQGALKVKPDGIIGPQTQLALCLREAQRMSIGKVPGGLIRGLIEGESGGQWACLSREYENHTRDYGPLQKNLLVAGSEKVRKEAFNVGRKCAEVAAEIAETHARYAKHIGSERVPDEREAWRLAVLFYNWETAADAIALGHNTGWLNKSFPFIEDLHRADLKTGWDWCTFYINSKTTYVTTWEVAHG